MTKRAKKKSPATQKPTAPAEIAAPAPTPEDVEQSDVLCRTLFPSGLPRSAVICLHGMPGVGKSTVAAQVASWAARAGRAGRHVLYLSSLEKAEAIRDRFVRLGGRVPPGVTIVHTNGALEEFLKSDYDLVIADDYLTEGILYTLKRFTSRCEATVLVTSVESKSSPLIAHCVDVDVHLDYFRAGGPHRIWEVQKNRFEHRLEPIRLLMTDRGLRLMLTAMPADAPPDDGLEADVAAIRARIRLNCEAENQRKIAARESLRTALSELSLRALVDRTVQLSEEAETLRAENQEWRNTRDKNGEKAWRSQYAYLDAVATELDSQRARCEELQAQLSEFGRGRSADATRMQDEMTSLIAAEKSKFAGIEESYAAALARETNKKERLELNLVTLLESLQVIGVGGVGAGPARSG
jgi:KaiC/GvpD/RAD55 family RecA-like ATPase